MPENRDILPPPEMPTPPLLLASRGFSLFCNGNNSQIFFSRLILTHHEVVAVSSSVRAFLLGSSSPSWPSAPSSALRLSFLRTRPVRSVAVFLASSMRASVSVDDSPSAAPRMPPMGSTPRAAFMSMGGPRRSTSCVAGMLCQYGFAPEKDSKKEERVLRLTLCSMSAMISLVSVICFREMSLSSGECSVASSTSLFCSLSLVLSMAASSSLAASSRSSWLTSRGGAAAASPVPSSSAWAVTDANSSASESLKCASAMISESSPYSCCLYLRDSRASAIALGYLRRG